MEPMKGKSVFAGDRIDVVNSATPKLYRLASDLLVYMHARLAG